MGKIDYSPASKSASAIGWHEAARIDGFRVLVAVSDAEEARDICGSLEELGHTVCGVAGTGTEVMALAGTTRPDLTLMAVRLDQDDGIDTARRLRSEEGVRSLFLTGYADHNTMSRITAAYPLGVVHRPYSMTQLKAALDLALGRVRASGAMPRG